MFPTLDLDQYFFPSRGLRFFEYFSSNLLDLVHTIKLWCVPNPVFGLLLKSLSPMSCSAESGLSFSSFSGNLRSTFSFDIGFSQNPAKGRKAKLLILKHLFIPLTYSENLGLVMNLFSRLRTKEVLMIPCIANDLSEDKGNQP